MKDEQMGTQRPGILRYQTHQHLLYFIGVCFGGQTKPRGQALDMRINGNSLCPVEGIAEDDIRRLAPHARETYQSFHGVWHGTLVLRQNLGAAALNVAGFLTIKAR